LLQGPPGHPRPSSTTQALSKKAFGDQPKRAPNRRMTIQPRNLAATTEGSLRLVPVECTIVPGACDQRGKFAYNIHRPWRLTTTSNPGSKCRSGAASAWPASSLSAREGELSLSVAKGQITAAVRMSPPPKHAERQVDPRAKRSSAAYRSPAAECRNRPRLPFGVKIHRHFVVFSRAASQIK